jgi:methionyl-tRNA synthetase
MEEEQEPTLENALKNGWPCDVHIIGKDILRFHAVYWPAMLMSADMPLPGLIYSHGFLTKDGLKMGKSLGNVLEPNDLLREHGSDAVRYYFRCVVKRCSVRCVAKRAAAADVAVLPL